VPNSGPSSGAPPPPVEVPKQAFSLTISSGAVFTASLLVQVLGLVGSIVLIKQTNGVNHDALVAMVGTVQLFLLIGSSVNGVGDLRLGTAYTYFLARGKPATDNTTTYLVVRMAMVGVAGLILFVLGPLVFGSSLAAGGSEYLAFGLFMFLPLLWSLSTVYNSMFIGEGNSLRAQYPSLVEALARLPFLFYVAYHDFTILGMTLAYVAGATASAVYSFASVSRRMGRFSKPEGLRLFRFAWPLMASLLINYLVTNSVPLIVGIGLGTRLLSVFLAANGFRILILSLPTAITTPLFPYLAGLHRQQRYEAIREGTWQALRYSAMLLVPGVVALVTYRYNFLNVFYTSFYASNGALAMALLSIGALPLALSQVIQSGINAIGRQRLELYITSTQVMVLFAMVGLVIPPWGPLSIYPGVVAGAVAILASSIAALALNTYFMETLIRVHIHPRSILFITVSAAGSFAFLWLINHNIHPSSTVAIAGGFGDRFATLWLSLHSSSPVSTWYELLVVVVVGFVVYFVILALVGELTQTDVRRIGLSAGLPQDFVETLAAVPWRVNSPELPPVDLATAPGLRSTELPETFTGTRELPEIVSDEDLPVPDEGSKDRRPPAAGP
jgi:O-antigen/teichoic acid export membrane protein